MKTGLAHKRRGWHGSEHVRPGERARTSMRGRSEKRARGRWALAVEAAAGRRLRVLGSRAVLPEDELGCVSCMIASCVQHASEAGHRTTAGYRKGPRRLAAWRLGRVACGC